MSEARRVGKQKAGEARAETKRVKAECQMLRALVKELTLALAESIDVIARNVKDPRELIGMDHIFKVFDKGEAEIK